ncbi:MAG: rubredoxin-like domain-containing protein [Nanobdellota archaeon]
MTLWKCSNCGYIHEDEEAPEECPKCGAPKEAFNKLDEQAEDLVQKSRVSNEAHMALLGLCEEGYGMAQTLYEEKLDDNCVAIAERAMGDFEEIIQSIKAELEAHMKKGKWG